MLQPIHFDLLGYFALGIFVGTITCHAIRFAKDYKTSTNAIGIILPAALGGVAMTFLELWDKADHGMPAYALGLLMGLMWVRASVAIENIRQKDTRFRIIGWAHLMAVAALSMFSAWLFLVQGAVDSRAKPRPDAPASLSPAAPSIPQAKRR